MILHGNRGEPPRTASESPPSALISSRNPFFVPTLFSEIVEEFGLVYAVARPTA
jgi:hypothetical protein